MRFKKLKKNLEKQYGSIPKIKYQPGDLENIKEYYEFRRDEKLDPFLIDDLTASDIAVEDVYKRINHGLSTSGEQVLYYMLRRPSLTQEEYDERKAMIDFVESDQTLRLKLQVIFAKLGRNRTAKVCQTFKPSRRNPLLLIGYILLSLGLVFSAIMIFLSFSQLAIFGTLFFTIVNPMIREWRKRGMYTDFETVNYAVSMIATAKKLKKVKSDKLQDLLKPIDASYNQLKSLLKVGGVSVTAGNEIAEMLSTWLLIDLITYEIIKNKLGKTTQEIFILHEYLGKIDAAVAIASYRKSMTSYCTPNIDFSKEAKHKISSTELVHPLLEGCVPNDFSTMNPMLLTGSNASGKSTFLKSVTLNLLMGQAICTCTAKTFDAASFRIYSSMAISDSLLAGESYYISEIKSLKRILDASQNENRIFCVVDEVLRGTNTIERIAASTQILKAFKEKSVLAIAATHDLELCQLLSEQYESYHFQEEVDAQAMTFDYKLRSGAATSRNAIKLLGLMGFEPNIILEADHSAKRYTETGQWR